MFGGREVNDSPRLDQTLVARKLQIYRFVPHLEKKASMRRQKSEKGE